MSGRSGLRAAAPAALLGALGLVAASYPALLSGFDELQIRHGDPRLVHYALEHSWLWATGGPGHGSFWDPPIYWPAENASALTDVVLGSAPLYWLARGLGAPTGPAMQLWMLACLALSYAAAWIFLRRVAGTGPWPAAVGAFLFGFGSARLANFNSPQLFPLFWGVLALTALGLAIQGRNEPRASRGWLAAAAACGALQTWSAFYPSFFLAGILAVAGLAALLLPESRAVLADFARRRGAAAGVSLLGAALAVAPLAVAHLEVARSTGIRPWAEVRAGLPTWASWIFQGDGSLLYGALADREAFRFASAASQHANGVGLATAVAALLGLALARRPLARVTLATTAAVLVLTVDWGAGASAWRAVYELVPGGGAVRYVARIGLWLPLPAALGVALLLERLLRRPSLRARVPLAVALAALLLAEQLHRLGARNETRYRASVARVAEAVDPSADAFFLSTVPADGAPAPSLFARQVRARQTHLVAMWAGLEADVPTVNGFYGLDPAGWRLADPSPRTPEGRRALDARLSAWLEQEGAGTARVQRLTVPAEWMPWSAGGSQR